LKPRVYELAIDYEHRMRFRLATGLRTGATLAVTNDEGWRSLAFIDTVILSDLVDSG